MVDFEWGVYDQVCLAESIDKTEYPSTCTFDSYQMISSVIDSIGNLNPGIVSFAHFDLNFSDNELNLLSKIEINQSSTLVTWDGLQNLESEVYTFLNKVLIEDNKSSISLGMSKLIAKLTSNIMSIFTQYEPAISLVAYNDGLGVYSPYWHIDKTHTEELNLPNSEDIHDIQYVFIITLKGTSTIYQAIDYNMRDKLFYSAKESSHTYYWPDGIFNESNKDFANFGQGSVHIAGQEYGAIHGTPEGKERLLMIVTPNERSTINALKDKYSYYF